MASDRFWKMIREVDVAEVISDSNVKKIQKIPVTVG
jgi:hypothetical protein